ncbi:MAG: bacteriohemerythrin [Oligoflexales bacterium]
MDKNKFLLGIKEIDKSHSKLMKVIENLELCFAKEQPYPNEEISELLVDAEDFATSHFRQEEELMIVFGYPLFREHRNQHDLFFRKLEKLAEFKDNEQIPSKEVRNFSLFLNNWFKDHICNDDKRYAEWIQERVLNIVS